MTALDQNSWGTNRTPARSGRIAVQRAEQRESCFSVLTQAQEGTFIQETLAQQLSKDLDKYRSTMEMGEL